MITPNQNIREFDSLDNVTNADVQWLIEGSKLEGYRIHNPRSIYYKTKRGVSKGITCFVYSDGSKNWRAWSMRNTYDSLSDEEAKVFDPETYNRRMERKNAWKAKEQAAKLSCIPVHVGDVFYGSFGYDATLYVFHQVVRVSKSGKTVWTRELRHETTSGYSYNDWKCRPAVNDFKGAEERHTVQYRSWNSGKPSISLTSYMDGNLLSDVTEWHDADNYH